MTTYVAIPNGDIDQDSPGTQPLFTALRDNPIAIAEGDATAPRIDPILAMAHQGNQNTVGSYMLAVGNVSTNTNYDFGQTLSGSSLDPAGIENGTTSSYSTLTTSTTNPGGTWRCMGRTLNSITGQRTVTLWLRIS